MTGKRTKQAPETQELTADALAGWLRNHMGDTKQEAFAAEIGVTRQALFDVLSGRRPPGPTFRRKLKRLGFVGVRTTYLVVKEKTV